MSSKKLILLIFGLMLLFALFMKYTFISIQKEAVRINTYKFVEGNNRLDCGIKQLNRHKEFEFLEDMAILLIDHIEKEAVIWSEDSIESIDYSEIPENLKRANTFFLEINGRKTMLINTDFLLGDLEERLISESYKYSRLSQSKLDPYKAEYFPTKNEDIRIRYYRNKIINELIKAKKEKTTLEKVKYYFNEWENYARENYNAVANYDFYEGFREFYKVKVKEKKVDKFDLCNYLEHKRNAVDFFQKEDEYKIIGLLLIDYAQENDIDLIEAVQTDRNMYKKILYKVPLIEDVDDTGYKIFKDSYNKWLAALPKIIDDDVDKFKASNSVMYTHKDILSEYYEYTFKVTKNYYIYFNYKARFMDHTTITKDYVLVHIFPNTIEYYYDIEN